MRPILRTKLYALPVRAELTSRPRLLARLDAGLGAHCKLTLISAPADYGKTTLAAEWLSQKTADEQTPLFKAAWLSPRIQAITIRRALPPIGSRHSKARGV